MHRQDDIWTFGRGENFHSQNLFGVHRVQVDGQDGYVFRVWAPNAQAVAVIGDFTDWSAQPLARCLADL